MQAGLVQSLVIVIDPTSRPSSLLGNRGWVGVGGGTENSYCRTTRLILLVTIPVLGGTPKAPSLRGFQALIPVLSSLRTAEGLSGAVG